MSFEKVRKKRHT